jgi:S1-C subfamily serine protease
VLVAEEGEISERGAVILLVQEGGPVDRAGLRPADVIIELGGSRVDETADLMRILGARAVGSSLPLAFVRDGQVKTGWLEVAGPAGQPGPQAFRLRPRWR